jgi:thioredoxin reductase (NADPH)
MGGVELLGRAHTLYPDARRGLLQSAGDNAAMEPLLHATALGQVDFRIYRPWASPEEWLYPQVQEAISAWASVHLPRFERVSVIGEQWSQRSSELRDVLARNSVPYAFRDASSEEGRRLLEEHGLYGTRLPVVIVSGGAPVIDPDNAELADALGVRTRPDAEPYDLVVVGSGPAGLAAAVYGTSEGLRTVVIEQEALGGQAGTSSMIRNYLGFPRGVSGRELAARAYEQSYLFGAQFVFAHPAISLRARADERIVRLTNSSKAIGRAVVIATGVSYRRLGIPSLDSLLGRGVFYGAGAAEAAAMAGNAVYVVGAGNSAGQAALHLARFASQVTMLARGDSLAETMSDYLISEIGARPNIDVRLRTLTVGGRGNFRLEGLVLEDAVSGKREEVPAGAAFVLIGAEPRTEWLADGLIRDDSGYLVTGRDLSIGDWPLARPPLPFETCMPGVFAVGDVRSGSVKRVASAVGEGSVTIRHVHEYLSGLG